MVYIGDFDDWGVFWVVFVNLLDMVNWDLILDFDIVDCILGVEGIFWFEFIM